MGRAALLLLLVGILSCWDQRKIVEASDKEARDVVSNVHLELKQDHLYLSWELFKESGYVDGYKIIQDFKENEAKHWPYKPSVMPLDFDPDTRCFAKQYISITPHDKDFALIGVNYTVTFTWQDIVTNVTLVPGENEIIASWDVQCLSASLRQFLVTWQSRTSGFERACVLPAAARNTVQSSDCIGKKLYPCSFYDVSVQAVDNSTADIGIPALENAFTLPESTFSVENFQILKQGPTSTSLAWKKPNVDCLVTVYTFTYSGSALWGEKKSHSGEVQIKRQQNVTSEDQVTAELKTYGSDEMVGVIENIWPYSAYKMCIGFGNIKRNSSNNCVHLQTLEAKPSAPRHLNATVKNPHSIEVSWQKPDYINGIIVNYIIRVLKDGISYTVPIYQTETDTILGFEDCANYSISVTAATGAGEGKIAHIYFGRLTEGCVGVSTVKIWGIILAIIAVFAVVLAIIFMAWRYKKPKAISKQDDATEHLMSPIRNSSKRLSVLLVGDSRFRTFVIDSLKYKAAAISCPITDTLDSLIDTIGNQIKSDTSAVLVFGMYSDITRLSNHPTTEEWARLLKCVKVVKPSDLVEKAMNAEKKWKLDFPKITFSWILPYPVNFLQYNTFVAEANKDSLDSLSSREEETSKEATVFFIKTVRDLKAAMIKAHMTCIDLEDVVCNSIPNDQEINWANISWKEEALTDGLKLTQTGLRSVQTLIEIELDKIGLSLQSASNV